METLPGREGARRIHVEDLCQLSGLATEHKYRSSMEKVGTVVRDLATAPGDDALRLFEVTVFSFLVGNSDMHLKNWTLVRDAGRAVLSPAYDLLPVRLLVDDQEEFALPINGSCESPRICSRILATTFWTAWDCAECLRTQQSFTRRGGFASAPSDRLRT
jgi:hypothetical protein